MPHPKVKDNRTLQILRKAEAENYGVAAAIVYDLTNLLGIVAAAEHKRAPVIILFFPWAIAFSRGLLVRCAADAARRATVPVAIHLDHAQDAGQIRHIADHHDDLPFDSIMVDMSHHDKAENLARTRELVAYCHERGIATEAEPGRIEGGEDGVGDTKEKDLKGLETTVEEAREFIDTGVDMLAPAIGNVHGEYASLPPRLDFERLEELRQICREADVRLVLHGTNSFEDELIDRCVKGGLTKLNVNKLVLEDYHAFVGEKAKSLPTTELMEEGVRQVQRRMEWLIEVSGSAGKG